MVLSEEERKHLQDLNNGRILDEDINGNPYCDWCDKTFKTKKNGSKHLNSKSHIKKVKQTNDNLVNQFRGTPAEDLLKLMGLS